MHMLEKFEIDALGGFLYPDLMIFQNSSLMATYSCRNVFAILVNLLVAVLQGFVSTFLHA